MMHGFTENVMDILEVMCRVSAVHLEEEESLLVTRIVLNFCKINMLTTAALWSPDERANKPTQKQITLVSAKSQSSRVVLNEKLQDRHSN